MGVHNIDRKRSSHHPENQFKPRCCKLFFLWNTLLYLVVCAVMSHRRSLDSSIVTILFRLTLKKTSGPHYCSLVTGNHRWLVYSLHKGTVTEAPFSDVITVWCLYRVHLKKYADAYIQYTPRTMLTIRTLSWFWNRYPSDYLFTDTGKIILLPKYQWSHSTVFG